MNALARLGPYRIDTFMRDVWQRRPLLVRQALPQFRSPVTREQLFRLAARDDVESRCVTAFGGRWRLAHGPFAGDALPPLSRRRWTLLVQGLDLHLPAAAELLSRFRFVSDARLDDLMASFATDGGGVGPHVDSYDVFLIQAHGRRRWRIGRQRDRALVPGLPLAILSDFRPSAEWVLEPGDLLYLPPGVAHDGVALGQCITLSVGFRSPAWQELAEPWFLQQAARARMPGRYADAGARPTGRPGALPAAMIDETWRRFARLRPRRSDGIEMLLAVLTEAGRRRPPPSPAPRRQAGCACASIRAAAACTPAAASRSTAKCCRRATSIRCCRRLPTPAHSPQTRCAAPRQLCGRCSPTGWPPAGCGANDME